jgi:hypothetical protein
MCVLTPDVAGVTYTRRYVLTIALLLTVPHAMSLPYCAMTTHAQPHSVVTNPIMDKRVRTGLCRCVPNDRHLCKSLRLHLSLEEEGVCGGFGCRVRWKMIRWCKTENV